MSFSVTFHSSTALWCEKKKFASALIAQKKKTIKKNNQHGHVILLPQSILVISIWTVQRWASKRLTVVPLLLHLVTTRLI